MHTFKITLSNGMNDFVKADKFEIFKNGVLSFSKIISHDNYYYQCAYSPNSWLYVGFDDEHVDQQTYKPDWWKIPITVTKRGNEFRYELYNFTEEHNVD